MIEVTGVVLAGGQAKRMNNKDKGLILINGKPLIKYVLDTLEPQVNKILINANRNLDQYSVYGYPVIADQDSGYLGPLSGMLTALKQATTDYIFVVPCDTPLLPGNIVSLFTHDIEHDPLRPRVAHDAKRIQPLFALLHKSLIENLTQFIGRGERKAEIWILNQNPIIVNFADQSDCFVNINQTEDISKIEKKLRQS